MGSSLTLASPNQELIPFTGLISVNTTGLIVVISPQNVDGSSGRGSDGD